MGNTNMPAWPGAHFPADSSYAPPPPGHPLTPIVCPTMTSSAFPTACRTVEEPKFPSLNKTPPAPELQIFHNMPNVKEGAYVNRVDVPMGQPNNPSMETVNNSSTRHMPLSSEVYIVIINGVERLAQVLNDNGKEVFVHYLNMDSQLDAWVPYESLRRFAPTTMSSAPTTSHQTSSIPPTSHQSSTSHQTSSVEVNTSSTSHWTSTSHQTSSVEVNMSSIPSNIAPPTSSQTQAGEKPEFYVVMDGIK
jgi:hypothetical protein